MYESISRSVTDVLGSASDTRFDLEDYIGLQRVLGFTALICVVDIVLITAIATLCAFLYNLSASLLGGLEVTLAEEDQRLMAPRCRASTRPLGLGGDRLGRRWGNVRVAGRPGL